jgi:hypothetical protein
MVGPLADAIRIALNVINDRPRDYTPPISGGASPVPMSPGRF